MNSGWWRDESELDSDQQGIIVNSIKKDRLITGSPGTGKTNLLLLKALQMHRAGYVNIRLLVSTRSLRQFIADGSEQYKFDKSKIMTFDSWMSNFLNYHQITPKANSDYGQRRKLRVSQCATIADQYEGYYDALLIDEGQDCLPEEVALYRKLAKACWVAADSKQSIYKDAANLAAWRTVIAPTYHSNLKYNYRNGKAICELADAVSRSAIEEDKLLPFMQYNEKVRASRVEDLKAKSLNEQIDNLVDLLTTQLRAYPDEMLGVLCPKHEILTPVIDRLRKSPLAKLCVFQEYNDGDEQYMQFTSDTRIFACTVHSSKGLEATAVHIVGADHFWRDDKTLNLIYTAITRAKTSLTIHHCEDLIDFFQSAVNQSTNQRIKQQSIRDLFGGNNAN